MTGEVGDRLLVHAAVEQGGHKEVPPCVEMVVPAETGAVIDLAQVFCERVGMDGLAVLIGKLFPA